MEKISKEHIDQLSEDLVSKLITLGSLELTLTQEVEPEWQGAASNLLSTLGLRHAQLVMKELLTKFQPGGSPHFFVVKTLGQLATSNGMILYLSVEVRCIALSPAMHSSLLLVWLLWRVPIVLVCHCSVLSR